MSDRDHDRAVLDSLIADACAQQSALGHLPEPQNVKDFIQPLVEELDRKNEANRFKLKPKPAEKKADRASPNKARDMAEVAKRRGVEGDFEIVRSESKTVSSIKSIKRTPFEMAMEKKLRRRVRLLLSKDDWREKLMTVNPLHSLGVGGAEKKKIAGHHLMKIVRDSERVFGPWWKDPPRKIINSGNLFRGGDATK